ncbi:MAG: hypothetical protein M1813_007848 [Trichoglossum hirsutum]|jgi:hypothetical protein|nr:MAG: hypothetical protein M1813_007848 [Trichoglossum hirsutum]
MASDAMTSRRGTHRRPQHPRLLCSKCDDHPEGFRGGHELRRHMDRVHMPTRRVWITVDISKAENVASSTMVGEASTLDLPEKPLADCKSCREGKKYSAYYNAAAHLRRCHFNTLAQRRARWSTQQLQRSSTGDRKYPPIQVLRPWIKDIEVASHGATQKPAQEDRPIARSTAGLNKPPQSTPSKPELQHDHQ